MADYYWIYNGATVGNFQTAANWSQSASGSPASGTIPQADDFVHFGHATTIGNNLGRGSCELTNNTNALARLTLHEDYVELSGSSTEINFLSTGYMTSNGGGFDFVTGGFKIGMHINIIGAANAGNNGMKQILAVTTNSVQFTSGTGMVNETGATNIVTFTYTPEFDLNGNSLFLTSPAAGTLLTLNGKIKASATGYIFISGVHVSGTGNRFILLGDNAEFQFSTIFIRITGTTGGTRFDDGEYPRTELHGGSFSCDYVTPTSSKYNKAIFSQFFEAVNGITWLTSGNRRENVKKTFEILDTSNFALRTLNFKTGESRWIFHYKDNHFKVPVDGDYINYPANFKVEWYNIEISNPTNNLTGKASIPARRSLNVNSLTINNNAKLVGDFSNGGTTTVCSTTRPTILGAWNFSQVADGVYTSTLNNSNPITPAHGVRGAVQLSYDGGSFISQESFFYDYDSSSLVLCAGQFLQTSFIDFCQTYNPSTGGSGTNGTIWESNDSPSVLYYTDSGGTQHNLLAGGGGGGGTDEKVKINALDSTAGYLENKIVAGTGLNTTLAIVAPHGTQMTLNNESLAFKTIAVSGQTDVVADLLDDTLTLAAGANMTITTNATTDTITFASTGGGGGGGSGYPLFKHDENPTTTLFSPFRKLVGGDTIEIGLSGSGKDVSVFTPTITTGTSVVVDTITATHIGSQEGREYIFFGQYGRLGRTNITKYLMDTESAMGFKTMFVHTMANVNPMTVGASGGTVTNGFNSLFVLPMEEFGGSHMVRVIDAGMHGCRPLIFDPSAEEPIIPEEAELVKILIVTSNSYIYNPEDRRNALMPNYSFVYRE